MGESSLNVMMPSGSLRPCEPLHDHRSDPFCRSPCGLGWRTTRCLTCWNSTTTCTEGSSWMQRDDGDVALTCVSRVASDADAHAALCLAPTRERHFRCVES